MFIHKTFILWGPLQEVWWTLCLEVGSVHFGCFGGNWIVKWDLSPSMHQICWMGWMVRRSVQLMGNRASPRVLCMQSPTTCTLRCCQAVPWPMSQLCHLCSGSQSHPTICIPHTWHRWEQRGHGAGLPADPAHTSLWGVCNRRFLHCPQLVGKSYKAVDCLSWACSALPHFSSLSPA